MKMLAICACFAGLMGSGAAVAQAPLGVLQRPPAEAYPSMAGGAPQRVAEMRAQAARAETPDMVAAGQPPRTDMNRDGVISLFERSYARGDINFAEYQDQGLPKRPLHGTPK